MFALLPTAALLPGSAVERLILVLSTLPVMVVELLDSAIEATVDRISFERQVLAGQAKDIASAAVLLALGMSALCWAGIRRQMAYASLLGLFQARL